MGETNQCPSKLEMLSFRFSFKKASEGNTTATSMTMLPSIVLPIALLIAYNILRSLVLASGGLAHRESCSFALPLENELPPALRPVIRRNRPIQRIVHNCWNYQFLASSQQAPLAYMRTRSSRQRSLSDHCLGSGLLIVSAQPLAQFLRCPLRRRPWSS